MSSGYHRPGASEPPQTALCGTARTQHPVSHECSVALPLLLRPRAGAGASGASLSQELWVAGAGARTAHLLGAVGRTACPVLWGWQPGGGPLWAPEGEQGQQGWGLGPGCSCTAHDTKHSKLALSPTKVDVLPCTENFSLFPLPTCQSIAVRNQYPRDTHDLDNFLNLPAAFILADSGNLHDF